MSYPYSEMIIENLRKGIKVRDRICPKCGHTLALIVYGHVFEDLRAWEVLKNSSICYVGNGCCCYNGERDPAYLCTNCRAEFSDKFMLSELIECPLEAGGEIHTHECRDYETLRKKSNYRLLNDVEKICNVICPAMGKEAYIHTSAGKIIRGTIIRSFECSIDNDENHIIVSVTSDDSSIETTEDINIKDVESVEIIVNA